MTEVTHWDGPGLEAWQPWTPEEAARILTKLDAPWSVVGGWAIDLFLGRVTREHEDLEIALPRTSFAAARKHLANYALHAVGTGQVRRLNTGDPFPDELHQCWVLDEAAGKWRMDVMSEPGDVLIWKCRRDERINAPRDWMIGRTPEGIPFLIPEAVLLFKAKYVRPKDEADFASCLPEMTVPAKDWLRNALERVHPGHAWLGRLD